MEADVPSPGHVDAEHPGFSPRHHAKPSSLGLALEEENAKIKQLEDKLHSEVNIIPSPS